MSRALLAEAPCSGRPLAAKLGLKPNQHATFIDLPADLAGLAEAANFSSLELLRGDQAPGPRRELICAFLADRARFGAALPGLKAALRPDGALWVSWPKRTDDAPDDPPGDLTEDAVRAGARACGLVDVKACDLSDAWSGLKLVIPVAAHDAVR